MRAQDITQRRMHQVRAAVIAHDASAPLRIGDNRDAIADAERFPGCHTVRHKSRHRVERSGHFCELERARIVVESASIGHLPARFGVNHGAVQHYFTAPAGLQFAHGAIFANDRLYAAIPGGGRAIKIRLGPERRRQLGVGRIRSLLRHALPRRSRSRALLLHRSREAGLVEWNPEVSRRIQYEVQRQAVGVVELERLLSRVNASGLLRGRAGHSGQRAQVVLEPLQRGVESARKPLLFRAHYLWNVSESRSSQFGVRAFHQSLHCVNHFR